MCHATVCLISLSLSSILSSHSSLVSSIFYFIFLIFHFIFHVDRLGVQRPVRFREWRVFKESEIISLDAGLRLDGITALGLWHLIVAVLGNTGPWTVFTQFPWVCVQGLVTQWLQSYPCESKASQEKARSLQDSKACPRVITQTIFWNLANLVKIYSGITPQQQHRRKDSVQGERRHLSDTSAVRTG